MPKKYTAQCACGAVKFEFNTDPSFVAVLNERSRLTSRNSRTRPVERIAVTRPRFIRRVAI